MNKLKNDCRIAFAVLFLLSVGILGLLNAGCVSDKPVSVDYGTSKLYSRTDMDLAVVALKDDFDKMTGCRLYSLKFAGDERCRQELEIANRGRAQSELYTDCIVFDSVFRSPVAGGGAWEPNKRYYWSWVLARTGDGAWTVINKGYA